MKKEILIISGKGEKQESVRTKDNEYYFLADLAEKSSEVREDAGNFGIETSRITYHDTQPILKFLEFKQKDVAELLDTNASTISRWKNKNTAETLNKLQSKAVLDIDKVLAKGVRIFGSEDQIKEWLKTKNYALGGIEPIHLLKDTYGIEKVEGALDAMSWGSFM